MTFLNFTILTDIFLTDSRVVFLLFFSVVRNLLQIKSFQKPPKRICERFEKPFFSETLPDPLAGPLGQELLFLFQEQSLETPFLSIPVEEW